MKERTYLPLRGRRCGDVYTAMGTPFRTLSSVDGRWNVAK